MTNRIVIAGTQSGCGKTTITCALLKALMNRGIKPAAFKCGPDYIDPMFHSEIVGAKSSNLDSFFFDDNTVRYLLAENSTGCGIAVIEGVMGYYDGMGFEDSSASCWDIARITGSPVVLVINAKGISVSALAIIEGFVNYKSDSRVKGVIFNGCSAHAYEGLKKAVLDHFGGKIIPLGYMPRIEAAELSSRHLGLVTAQEVKGLTGKINLLAEAAEKYIDTDALLKLSESAAELTYEEPKLTRREPVRIAVAKDRAFCFYYKDSLSVLEKLGAELIYFSPLADEKLPDDIQGLYLGGGYPELYAKELSENSSMLESVKGALERKLPCIAECGGFMYLTEEIDGHKTVGYIKGASSNTGGLRRFGYITLTANKDNMLCKKGESIKAHEFHHYDSGNCGDAFRAEKKSGAAYDCVFADDNLYAGYPHFHFLANLSFAENFYNCCLKRKND